MNNLDANGACDTEWMNALGKPSGNLIWSLNYFCPIFNGCDVIRKRQVHLFFIRGR